MLSQNQIALLINSFSQLTTNTNYVTTIRITASYKTTQSFNYQGNTVKPLIDLYSGNTVVILQDTSTKLFYAIREDFNPVLNERTFTRKYREEEKKLPSRKEADVAVLLSCEKDDAYDFWITWLGDRRKNRFAYVGEMPKRLQTEQYWAWESNQGGRFEFNPYTGATGGFGGGVQSLTNYDGAIVDAGPQGAFYQSEGWHGGGDKGGVVTPIWSRVLTDYEVHASAYLQTLCHPLGTYTDVSWEWSDGATGLYKVDGGGATGSTSEKQTGKTWTVNWSYEGGGGGVSLNQEESPRVEADSESDRIMTLAWDGGDGEESYTGRNLSFTVAEDPSITTKLMRWAGTHANTRIAPCGTPTPLNNGYSPTLSIDGVGWWRVAHDADESIVYIRYNDSFTGLQAYTAWGWLLNIGNRAGSFVAPSCYYNNSSINNSIFWGYQNPQAFSRPDITGGRFNLTVTSDGDVVVEKTYSKDPSPYISDIQDLETYTIQVFDKDGIEVASDSADTPISHTTDELTHFVRGIYIQKKDGQNLGGQFQSGDPFIPDGFSAGDNVPHKFRRYTSEDNLTAEVETMDIYAQISAWVEVTEKELARVEIEGKEGQKIKDSSAYEIATRPYTGPDGKTVYPCYPQKSGADPKEESRKFQASDGFNAYHVTWYNTRKASINGDTTRHEPFDFNNPDLSGPLPSPAINYLTSLVSTDLIIDYVPVGNLSWGKDLPEEGTNLEEEKEDGVDPYGVVYSLVKGFTYALYGPTKTNQSTTIDGAAGETLLGNYDFLLFTFRNRQRKPRLYVLNPDKTNEGRPFEEYDISDLNQRGLHQLPSTMGETFRRELWGYDLSPVANEYEEDWATERVTFAANPSGGDTPFERQYLNDETANSSTVKQRGDKTVDITIKMEDVEALLKATSKARVEFTIHDSQRPSETTIKTFKMNPIQDVFEGYSDVKVLAVAGVIY